MMGVRMLMIVIMMMVVMIVIVRVMMGMIVIVVVIVQGNTLSGLQVEEGRSGVIGTATGGAHLFDLQMSDPELLPREPIEIDPSAVTSAKGLIQDQFGLAPTASRSARGFDNLQSRPFDGSAFSAQRKTEFDRVWQDRGEFTNF